MDLEAFILIGGRSSRFGNDKAFAAFGAETLAGRAVRTAKETFERAHIAVVVGRGDQFTAQALEDLACEVVTDQNPGLGAWSGIDSALTSARTEWIFIFACDLPLVSAEFLRLMAARRTPDIDTIVPRQPDGRLQPLCAFYRVQAAREVLSTFLVKPRSLPPVTTIFEKLNTYIVDVDEYTGFPDSENFFVNVNTVDDLSAAAKLE